MGQSNARARFNDAIDRARMRAGRDVPSGRGREILTDRRDRPLAKTQRIGSSAARHKVEKSIPVRDLSRDEVRPEVAEFDRLILGGGGILDDEAVAVYLREVELVQEHRVPVLVYAVSAGPLHDAAARSLVRDTLSRVDAVTVRERRARQCTLA